MGKKLTKKAFKEYLNEEDRKGGSEEGDLVNPHKNYQYGQRKRLYGDYLYSADKGMFDYYYELWINSGCKSMEFWEE